MSDSGWDTSRARARSVSQEHPVWQWEKTDARSKLTGVYQNSRGTIQLFAMYFLDMSLKVLAAGVFL